VAVAGSVAATDALCEPPPAQAPRGIARAAIEDQRPNTRIAALMPPEQPWRSPSPDAACVSPGGRRRAGGGSMNSRHPSLSDGRITPPPLKAARRRSTLGLKITKVGYALPSTEGGVPGMIVDVASPRC
jgi:hypothetical protein